MGQFQGGDFLQAKLGAPTGRVAALAASKLTDREAVEEMFLLTLSRRPTAASSGSATRGRSSPAPTAVTRNCATR